jgi:translation elongation factor EF-4
VLRASLASRLKELLDRQQYEVIIQVCVVECFFIFGRGASVCLCDEKDVLVKCN